MKRFLRRRVLLLGILHALLSVLAYEIAFQLRFDFAVPTSERDVFFRSVGWMVFVKCAASAYGGSLHGWWRYVTFADLANLLRITTIATLVVASGDYFFVSGLQIPRAVLLLDWGATILIFGGTRCIFRLLREHFWPVVAPLRGRQVLVVGVDPCTELIVRQIHANEHLNYHVIGYLDDQCEHVGATLGGIPILGPTKDAVELALAQGAEGILVIGPAVSGKRLRNLNEECRRAGLPLQVIPQVEHLLDGSFQLQVRDVNINDLLRREPVQLDTESIGSLVSGQCIMVTGAAGSIGSEMCRQLIRFEPRALILVDNNENGLFFLERELLGYGGQARVVPCIGNVRDAERMNSLFARHLPQIIFHAAAHKHVPMMELNPSEALSNNVFGTLNLAELADLYSVKHFVLISTDKAVNPSSVMGVSKQLAERVVKTVGEFSTTRFVIVRFGNVLGSNGSVVPIFQEQIRRGGPVTVTHRDMTRYFMTIPEASQLVLQAAAMGAGGEIFVLDMGEPVRIYDLAEDMIRLSGLRPNEDIDIHLVGVRPGEKLYEELHLSEEELRATAHPKVRAAIPRPLNLTEMHEALETLQSLVKGPDEALREKLQEIVREYQPLDFQVGRLAEAL